MSLRNFCRTGLLAGTVSAISLAVPHVAFAQDTDADEGAEERPEY